MVNNKNYKQTEIGRIPKDWEVVELDEVVDINKESRDPTKEFPLENFLYIDIDSIENETGVIKRAKTIVGKDAPSRARRVIHYNDVLMSTVRPYLKAFAIVPKEYDDQICSTGFAVLSSKGKILPSYLLYILFSRFVISQCNKMMVGAQYPALNISQVKRLKLPLPPLSEQKKIAEILSTVDETIEKVDEAIAKTERLKKGLMQNLLTNGIGHKEFKDTELGLIPEEWRVVRLVEIVDIFDKKRIPLSEIERSKMKGKFPYCGANGIIDYINDFIFDGKFLLLAEDGGNFKAFGQKAYLMFGKFWANNHVHVLKALSSLCSEEFLLYMLNFMDLKSWVVGSTRKKLNQGDMKKIPIPLPPLPEQKKIAEILSTVDKRLELLKNKKEKLKRIKKGLMNDLLTGKMRVKV